MSKNCRYKHIYFDPSNRTYRYACGKTARANATWRPVSSCCSSCRHYIIQQSTSGPVHNNKVPFYNGWNGNEFYFHGIRQPPELQGLSLAEKALISMIQVVLQMKTLKYGQASFTGHTVFVDRKQDVYKVANVLPRLPAECDIILLRRKNKRGNVKSLLCRRQRVQQALEWLVDRAFSSI